MTDDPTDIARADAMTSVAHAANHQALYNHHARILAMDERLVTLTKAVTACAEASMFYDSGRHGGTNFGYASVRTQIDDALKSMRAELAQLTADRSMMGTG